MRYGIERRWTGIRVITDRLRLFAVLSIITGVAAGTLWVLYVTLSEQSRTDFGRYLWVSYRVANDLDEPVELTINGERQRAPASAFQTYYREQVYHGRTITDVAKSGVLAGLITAAATMTSLAISAWRPGRATDDEIIRGARKYTPAELQAKLLGEEGVRTIRETLSGKARLTLARMTSRGNAAKMADQLGVELGVSIGGIYLPRSEEQSHIVILGDTGSGKSSLMRELMYQVRLRGEPAVVYDPEREHLETFWFAGDTILNPEDARMPPWTPGMEIESRADAEALAESFVPNSPSNHHQFWVEAARTLLVDIFLNADKYDAAALARSCAKPLEDLARELKGTPAASAISPKAPQMAESVRSTLMVATRGLAMLPKAAIGEIGWSAKEWSTKPSGWVFITSRGIARAASLPLITAWLDTLIRNLMNRPKGTKPVVWLFCDEVQTLKSLSQLEPLLTQGRKRSLVAVIGAQAISQLQAIYGEGAKTMLSQASTKILYRCSEPSLAKWASDMVGNVERITHRATLRADLTTRGRDYVNLNHDQRIEPLLLPSEIASLPNHQGYMVFRGMVARIAPKFNQSIKRVPEFIPRPPEPPMDQVPDPFEPEPTSDSSCDDASDNIPHVANY